MTNTIIQYTQEQEQKFISQLNDIIKNGGKYWQNEIINDAQRRVKKYTDLIEFINYKTPLLQDRHYLITTKIYWVLNGLTDFPRCKNPKCNKQIKKDIRVQFDGHKGYADFCCPKCAVSDERTQAKYKETCMNNWGVDNGSKAQEIKDKLREIQLFDYIRTIVPSSIDMLANDRTQMTPNERNNWKANHELDIWIPQLKIAIEYQGIFWHDPLRFPEKAYNDKEKQIQCEEKGIILIQVNENDWINREKLVKQKLRTIINEE